MGWLSDIVQLRHAAEETASSLPALMHRAEDIAISLLHGEHALRKSGAGEKFWQFREYHTTDRPQDIDWRQSAKTDHIFVKEKEWQAHQKTYLWCASGRSMDFSSISTDDTKQTDAQIITLSLALLLRKAEEHVGLYGDLKTGRSEETLRKVGQFLLDKADEDEELPQRGAFTLPRNSAFIGIGDFLSPIDQIKESLHPIANATGHALIIQVLDPAEIDLPFSGRVKFEGVEQEQKHIINNVASVRQEYTSKITAHINAVKSMCHDLNWHYILHRTDQDISDTLKTVIEKSAQERGAL